MGILITAVAHRPRIGHHILRRRLRIGIAAAADKAGLCSRSWGEIERGQHKPSVEPERHSGLIVANHCNFTQPHPG